MAGYSGTPLAKKLAIKPGVRVLVLGAPGDYRDWLAPLPEDVAFVSRGGSADCNMVHLFTDSIAHLRRELPKARKAIRPDGAIWVSWYKKSSGIATTSPKTWCATSRSKPISWT
jgi:hypothetical protein